MSVASEGAGEVPVREDTKSWLQRFGKGKSKEEEKEERKGSKREWETRSVSYNYGYYDC